MRPQRLVYGPINIGPDDRNFPWGPIDRIHRIGNIKIVEYRQDRSRTPQPEYWADHGTTAFHPFVDGRDTSNAFESLDSALVYAIAYKRCEANDAGYVARHFDLMTGVAP